MISRRARSSLRWLAAGLILNLGVGCTGTKRAMHFTPDADLAPDAGPSADPSPDGGDADGAVPDWMARDGGPIRADAGHGPGDGGADAGGERLIGYWRGYAANGRPLEQTSACVDVVALAFAVTQPGATADIGDTLTLDFLTSAHPEAEIRQGARFLQARGQKVIMSINGNPNWPGHPDGWGNLDPIKFAANVKQIVVDDWQLDGVDLDVEGSVYVPANAPDGNLVQVIHELRRVLGPDKLIMLPVYMGAGHDAYLQYVKDDVDAVSTMAYWNGSAGQIALLQYYQGVVGMTKAAIGVAEARDPGVTDHGVALEVAAHRPKFGMMLWTLDAAEGGTWADELCPLIRP